MRGRAGTAAATAAATIAVGVGALFVVPSDASLTPEGNCRVKANVQPGRVRIRPARSEGPFTVPLDGRVAWSASLTTQKPPEPRAFDGGLAVIGPGGLDEVLEGLFEFRSWSNPRSRRVQDRGRERYDLPSWTPRGVDIPVRGFQNDPLGGCQGEILVRVEGGRFDSPLAWVAIGATVFWLTATLLAGKLRDEPQGLFCAGVVIPAFLAGWLLSLALSAAGRAPALVGLGFAGVALVATAVLNRRPWAQDFWGGHPVLGWFAGLALGFFVSLDLFVFGIVRLDSSVLLFPPLLGLVGGVAMAWWTPFRGRRYA